MSFKRFLFAFFAVFIFIFLFEWIFHGILLKNLYAESQSLWRKENDMLAHFHWLILGQALNALVFTLIFTRGFAARGIRGGIWLGVVFGILGVSINAMNYAVQPLPGKLLAYWGAGGFIEFIVAGLLVGLIYKSNVA